MRLCGSALPCARHQPGRAGLEVEPSILMRTITRDSSDPLDEVVDTLGRTAFLAEYSGDNRRCLSLREAALAQESLPVLVAVRDDTFASGTDAADESTRRTVSKAFECGRSLMGKTVRGELAVAAYSAEVGRLFRSEVGHRADVKRATCTDPKRAIFGAPAWVL